MRPSFAAAIFCPAPRPGSFGDTLHPLCADRPGKGRLLAVGAGHVQVEVDPYDESLLRAARLDTTVKLGGRTAFETRHRMMRAILSLCSCLGFRWHGSTRADIQLNGGTNFDFNRATRDIQPYAGITKRF